jgi:tetratricopeptide (TPR) repeat protein
VPSGNGEGGAIPEVQAAIENARQNPTDFEAQMKAAELFYQIQRFDGATEFLKKANEIQPDNYEVIVNLGNASFDAEKYEDAEKWYSAALAKKPDDRDVRTDLGLTFVFRPKPDYDRAITEFKRVLDDDPGHKQALQNLTVAYTKKEDAANAGSTADRLEKVDPTNSSLAKLREDIAKISKK